MRFILDPKPVDSDPVTDVAIAHALLRQASDGEIGPTVRISVPGVPTAAFGRSDVRRAGFVSATEASRALGFAPIVRGAGGRVAAYTDKTLVIDHVSPDPDPGTGMRDRFRDYGALLTGVLQELGVDARLGAVPGEYCPGEYSVNARGVAKLVGTAQRIVRGAWLFSAVVVLGDGPSLRAALPIVHNRLELPLRRRSIGSVFEEAPGLDVDTVASTLVRAYDRVTEVDVAPLDDGTLARMETLRADHWPVVPGSGARRSA
ncbi:MULTISPECIES: lipoate--protein ligase family protein [Mumia]|uniref:lipoate--protein ligase family protein n=1 Tax=Mumia TaxID=1546255 RepID=UPI0015F9AC01|nr:MULTISPECIES: lipoate--protein ligase family protein [unclassified Mumia]QMW67826.1 lipoate--protein ligase family protein [Mumia sp. ZJ1417]